MALLTQSSFENRLIVECKQPVSLTNDFMLQTDLP